MKYILILLVYLPAQAFSQQLKIERTIGFSFTEFANAKRITQSGGSQLSYEFPSTSNYNFMVSSGYYKIKYSTDNSMGNHFNTATFITISAKLRNAFYTNRSTSIFFEIGPYASHLWVMKQETNDGINNIETKKKHPGYNYGMTTRFGLKSHLSGRYSLGILLGEDFDLITSYKNKADQLKNASTYLAFSFYMSL